MKISCYILTLNSARRLEQVLSSLQNIADDLLVVDSGSTDGTQDLAAGFGARVIYRRFDDFTTQRNFAVLQCRHNWILTIDSDEVVSPELLARLRLIKEAEASIRKSAPDAYAIRREWIVLRRKVHCFYPSRCPDFPIRLFRKDRAAYLLGRKVHETIRGFHKALRIEEPLLHYSCDSVEELYGKMNLYTTLASHDLWAKRGRPSLAEVLVMPWVVGFKWYVLLGGWRDGIVGAILARYVMDTVYQKYLKARCDIRPSDGVPSGL